MATYTFVDFEHADAAPLARLRSIRQDLASVLDLCRYFSAQFEGGYPPSEVIDAFSTAILVRYSRAFVSGVRLGLGEAELSALTEEQRLNHDQLRAFRDKHIAHSVNAFEDTRIQARYCAERVKEEGITSISAAHYRVVGIGSEDIGHLEELSETFIAYLDQAIEAEQTKLLGIVRALPLQEVLLRSSSPLMNADKKRIARRRQRQ